jgi:hypothetical protein
VGPTSWLSAVATYGPQFLPSTLSGFTIQNGRAQPGDVAAGSGGGIRDQGNASLTGVQSFLLATDGTLYYLQTNGNLTKYQAFDRTALDFGTVAIALDSANTLYDLESKGDLWKYQAGIWTFLDSNSNVIAADPIANDGTVYDLERNGDLWQRKNGVWTEVQSNIALLSLGVDDATSYTLI